MPHQPANHELEQQRTKAARKFARQFAIVAHAVIACGCVLVPVSNQQLAMAILAALLAGASYADLRWRRIPNWLTYPALAWTIGIAAWQIHSGNVSSEWNLSSALLGAAACFCCMLLVYRLAGSGAGDVKLAAAIGAVIGVEAGVSTILWCHLLAGFGMLVWYACNVNWRTVAASLAMRLGQPIPVSLSVAGGESGADLSGTTQVPLAAFFALGTLLSLNGASLL